MNLACSTCPVKETAACAVLTPEERDAMAAAGRTRVLKRGEMLFAAGDEDAACATLLTGALKVSAIDADGNEQILALVHPAGFIGELFAPFAHHDVVALTESHRPCQRRGAAGRAAARFRRCRQRQLVPPRPQLRTAPDPRRDRQYARPHHRDRQPQTGRAGGHRRNQARRQARDHHPRCGAASGHFGKVRKQGGKALSLRPPWVAQTTYPAHQRDLEQETGR